MWHKLFYSNMFFHINPHDSGALKDLLRLTLWKTVRNMLFDMPCVLKCMFKRTS